MTLDELQRQLSSNRQHEKTDTNGRTLYWLDQWRLLAEQAVKELERSEGNVVRAMTAVNNLAFIINGVDVEDSGECLLAIEQLQAALKDAKRVVQ